VHFFGDFTEAIFLNDLLQSNYCFFKVSPIYHELEVVGRLRCEFTPWLCRCTCLDFEF
jgi:hypothetical protein